MDFFLPIITKTHHLIMVLTKQNQQLCHFQKNHNHKNYIHKHSQIYKKGKDLIKKKGKVWISNKSIYLRCNLRPIGLHFIFFYIE